MENVNNSEKTKIFKIIWSHFKGQTWYENAATNYYENLPFKLDQTFFKMLIIFRDINIFQKDRNFTFFVIYSYKINILSSTWDH